MAENNKNKNKVQIDPTYAHLQPQAVNVEFSPNIAYPPFHKVSSDA